MMFQKMETGNGYLVRSEILTSTMPTACGKCTTTGTARHAIPTTPTGR